VSTFLTGKRTCPTAIGGRLSIVFAIHVLLPRYPAAIHIPGQWMALQ